MVFASSKKSLLKKAEWDLLSGVAVYRDLQNNGMKRAEAITMVMELLQCAKRKTATNHYDYLVRKKKLTGLKNNERAVAAQKTTTKRSQITIDQQYRWHTAVDGIMAEQQRLNQPAKEFEKVKEHFFLNMDELSLLASNGTVKVIGAAIKKKTENIMEDSRVSITVLRTGAAGGSTGPWIFLAAGKEITCKLMRNIDRKEGVPPHSKDYMTESAYMTDAVYAKIAPELADGIRKMPDICDHPDWWVIVSLDGFGSHVNVHSAQEAFYDRKIFILKEEGDTSHVNQAYDQSVAKNDKTGMRANLDAVCKQIGTRMDQWYLIAIAIEALKKIDPAAWISSFKKVNLHPCFRVSFEEWLDKINDKILTGEKFFVKRSSLFDVMPALWKHLAVEERHSVMAIIDSFHKDAKDGETVWSKQNILRLTKYTPLDDVLKLRGCYLAAKHDPSVLVFDDVSRAADADKGNTDRSNNAYQTVEPDQPTINQFCSWRPKELLEKYKVGREENKMEFFHHITNYVAASEWD